MISPQALTDGLSVRLEGVYKSFAGGVRVIDGVDLDVAPGEFVAVLGPSGCGKSTLLRIIAGLERADAGHLQIVGKVEDGRTEVAYVFQDAHLLPWRNVLKNVALPLELMGIDKPARLAAARDAVAKVGLSDAIGRYPNQLSGGMRMRVSLARALVTKPRLLLLDEPFAALDEITRQHLDEQLHRLWRAHRMTVIFVTHSTEEAAFLAERAVVLTGRPARIVEDRRIDLPADRPAGVRGTPEFAHQTRAIYAALERGGA